MAAMRAVHPDTSDRFSTLWTKRAVAALIRVNAAPALVSELPWELESQSLAAAACKLATMRVANHRPALSMMLVGALLVAASVAQGQNAAAFRFGDLDLRDPHVFVDVLGCRDVTDTALLGFSVNGALQARIQTDTDADGLLDLSYVVEFLPLDTAQPTNLIDFGTADCSAPLSNTACTEVLVSALAGDAMLASSATCAAPLPGTTRPYAPAIASANAPCFVSPVGSVSLDLGGIPVTLQQATLAATFVGAPPASLGNGLLRGFISEADANAIILPGSLPLIGGRPLSAVLPGGTGNCAAHSDKDVVSGVTGWWFYLNFPATRVPRSDTVAVFADGFEPD